MGKSNDSTQCFVPQRRHHTKKDFKTYQVRSVNRKTFIINTILIYYSSKHTAGKRWERNSHGFKIHPTLKTWCAVRYLAWWQALEVRVIRHQIWHLQFHKSWQIRQMRPSFHEIHEISCVKTYDIRTFVWRKWHFEVIVRQAQPVSIEWYVILITEHMNNFSMLKITNDSRTLRWPRGFRWCYLCRNSPRNNQKA